MSDDKALDALRKDFDAFKRDAKREIEAQAKAIRKLEAKVKDIEGEQSRLLIYVNNLMRKADNLIKSKFDALRRTQVHATQKMNNLDSEVSQLAAKLRRK